MRAGFPHSDICGSMLVCQLPAAFRRLPRPSSPVIAKASTSCTLSLDPITVHPRLHSVSSHRLARFGCAAAWPSCTPGRVDTIIKTQSIGPPVQSPRHTSPPEPSTRSNRFTSSTLLKNSRLQMSELSCQWSVCAVWRYAPRRSLTSAN